MALVRNASYTTQMLGYAKAQLAFLQQESNRFRQRVIKHAFLAQLSAALLSYLEEIDVLKARDLPAVGLMPFLAARLNMQAGDFRAQELVKLLQTGFVYELLQLYESSQYSVQVGKNQADEEEGASMLIASSAPALQMKPWWDCELDTLASLAQQLEDLIQRQREIAAEA